MNTNNIDTNNTSSDYIADNGEFLGEGFQIRAVSPILTAARNCVAVDKNMEFLCGELFHNWEPNQEWLFHAVIEKLVMTGLQWAVGWLLDGQPTNGLWKWDFLLGILPLYETRELMEQRGAKNPRSLLGEALAGIGIDKGTSKSQEMAKLLPQATKNALKTKIISAKAEILAVIQPQVKIACNGRGIATLDPIPSWAVRWVANSFYFPQEGDIDENGQRVVPICWPFQASLEKAALKGDLPKVQEIISDNAAFYGRHVILTRLANKMQSEELSQANRFSNRDDELEV